MSETADQLALTQLTARYAAAVDTRDWHGLAGLFAADAVLVTPGSGASVGMAATATGREEIVTAVRQVEAFARTFHHLTGSVWTIDGTAAAGRTTCVAHHVEGGAEPRSWAWHVIYDDRCVRDGTGWLLERRQLTVAMIEARPMFRVLPFETPAGP